LHFISGSGRRFNGCYPNQLQQQGSVCPEVVVCSTYVHLEEVVQEKADVRRKNSLFQFKIKAFSRWLVKAP